MQWFQIQHGIEMAKHKRSWGVLLLQVIGCNAHIANGGDSGGSSATTNSHHATLVHATVSVTRLIWRM